MDLLFYLFTLILDDGHPAPACRMGPGKPALVARSEVILRALPLEPALDAEIQSMRKTAWNAERSGQAEQAATLYEAVWQRLPELERGRWDSSYVIINDALHFHVPRRQWNAVWRWMRRLQASVEHTQNSGLLTWLARVHLAQGHTDAALACLDVLHGEWGTRPFFDDPALGPLFFARRGPQPEE
jgi:hypothetical protein